VPLVLTLVAVTALLTVVPLGDGSYQCQRRPIALVREPAVETGGESFFDEGAACNADARRRVTTAADIAVVAALVTVGITVTPRLGQRAARPRPPTATHPS
jgi:hypothetical protein